MFFGIFVLNKVLIFSIIVLNRVSFLRQEPVTLFLDDKEPALMFYGCLKLVIKNRNSVLNRVGKSAIFVLNRVRVRGTEPHLPTQGYIEYPPPPGPMPKTFVIRSVLSPKLNDGICGEAVGWDTLLSFPTWERKLQDLHTILLFFNSFNFSLVSQLFTKYHFFYGSISFLPLFPT